MTQDKEQETGQNPTDEELNLDPDPVRVRRPVIIDVLEERVEVVLTSEDRAQVEY